jgi:hypothetical protein
VTRFWKVIFKTKKEERFRMKFFLRIGMICSVISLVLVVDYMRVSSEPKAAAIIISAGAAICIGVILLQRRDPNRNQ